MSEETPPVEAAPEITCSGCGAILRFLPGTTSLVCEYCGTRNAIAADHTAVVEEIGYETFLKDQYEKEDRMEVVTLRCEGCGATVSLDPHVTSDRCPYCATPLVVSGGSTSRVLKPRALVPFQVEKKDARACFDRWLKGLWFAPSDLKKRARRDALEGVYIPYWTYDAATTGDYTGQRGDHYYVTEMVTVRENGRTVTRPRQVRRTRWSPAAGRVDVSFDDVLVPATRSLDENQVQRLAPWHLGQLVPFQADYLRGFRTQAYQVELTEGMEQARHIMEAGVRDAVRDDIGGDEQRILSLAVEYRNVTFKHILLPLWISSFRYGEKIYRFLINGQTGEVQGKRPYSWFKIIGLLLGIVAVVFILAAVL